MVFSTIDYFSFYFIGSVSFCNKYNNPDTISIHKNNNSEKNYNSNAIFAKESLPCFDYLFGIDLNLT